MTEDWSDEIDLNARILKCRTLWFDPRFPEAQFSLAGVFTHFEPPEGVNFPFRIERVFVYLQFWGTIGQYSFRIRFVKIELTDDHEEVELHLGSNGQHRDFDVPTKRPVEISGLNYVEEMGFPIGPIPIRTPELYEFQLFVNDEGTPIARERIMARN